MPRVWRRPRSAPTGDGLGIGFVANFFDTLGIGSFATTTAYVKFRNLVRDEHLPGTLNVGHALPTIIQAIIFTTAIAVAPLTLVSMVAAAVAGGYLGAGVVSKLPRRSIQLGMGIALLIAAAMFVMKVDGVLPPGGNALGLTGGVLIFAIVVNFLLGALMQLGIGLYAPVPDAGQPAGHEPDRCLPDHDGLVRVPDAGRQSQVHP